MNTKIKRKETECPTFHMPFTLIHVFPTIWGWGGIGMGKMMFTNNYSFSFFNNHKTVSQCGAQSCFDEDWPLRHTQLLYLSFNFHNVTDTVSTVHIV